jgi:ribonuclease VapC
VADPILDASAVLAFIFGEPGAERVAAFLPGARISAINAAEVMSKLADLGMPEDTLDAIMEDLQLAVLPFDMAHARDSARLRPLTRGQGISAGDRGCLAVARSLGTSVLTTDRAWARLDAAVGVTVELVR